MWACVLYNYHVVICHQIALYLPGAERQQEELNMHKKKQITKRMVLLSMLSGILLVMSFTPLGYLNIGPLAISLNMIPVAIGAVALGPSGGAFLGTMFGITSCLQCVGIGGTSAMGMVLFEISPLLTIIQRLVPRFLAGWLAGIIYLIAKKFTKHGTASCITGFFAAFLNTVFFINNHIVTKIVKSHFVICTVGNICSISFATCFVILFVNNQTHRQSKEVIELAHPLTVTLCKIVIDGYDMHTFARKSIKVCRKGCNQSFTFTCFHF